MRYGFCFFCKQKTAYEMRISDWSSDVCSSDLIMPRQIGLSMYQLDSNLRASAVVGIVGAGGIGSTLMNAFGRYDYDFALAITMIIIAAILISEAISGRIRRAIW